MDLQVLTEHFSVCKVKDLRFVDYTGDFVFVGKTDQEISLVCGTDRAPEACLERDDGWRCLRIKGELDFSLVGVLAGITEVLARQKIGIFAVSTYNTDYVLVREENLARAVEALGTAGYGIDP